MNPKDYGYWIGFRRVESKNIPQGWKYSQLREVANFRAGGSLKLTMSDYVPEGIDAYSAEGLNGKTNIQEFTGPAVIVSSIGARCGKCFYVPGAFTTLANIQVVFTNSSDLNAKFLWNVINRESFWDRYATAQPFIRPSEIKKSWIPIPPPDEQAAITSVLDGVDVAIDGALMAISKAKELKRALLQDFFYSALGVTAYADRPTKKLPMGWSLVSTDQLLASEPKNGVSPKASSQPPGIPTFSIAAIREGRVDLSSQENLKYAEVSEKIADKFRLAEGDVLITRGNANPELVGKAGRVSEFPEGCIYPDITKRVVFRKDGDNVVTPEYAVLAWNHPVIHNQVLRRAKTSNGTLKINNRDVKQIVMPVPPPGAQEQIVSITNAVESKIDAMSSKVRALERLKMSLMHDLLTGTMRVDPKLFKELNES